jgi:hypothetical protein
MQALRKKELQQQLSMNPAADSITQRSKVRETKRPS